ncbi:60S ribosomal protein L13 [Portunus trituberculatus]|uniref:Large ribosomal subunit protein eL13 n=1 Tax=Portunus trituberculatus TaxID=210409 RepID=A0A5B7D572_PORTR|nr:60S ribosomal protein L13 [Portunus trituberculatus]
MAPKRNNIIPNCHFHKDWQRYVRTWFNQPARKQRRRNKRQTKARQVAPRPLGKLRPIVRCPTFKNMSPAPRTSLTGVWWCLLCPLRCECEVDLKVVHMLAKPQEIALAQQMKGVVMPHIPKAKKEKARGISKRQKKYSCFNALRRERAVARTWGMRAKKAKEAAEDAAVTGKK